MRDLLEALQENLQGEYKLSSTQIYVPTEIASEVLKFTLSIPEEDLYIEEDGGMGRELEVHVTIKYGLTAKSPEEVEAAVKEYGKKDISVELGKVSLFESDKPFDVIKFDIDSKDLVDLNKIFSALDNKDTHPDYKPHCTVAYVRKGLGQKYLGKQDIIKGKSFSVDNFYFCSPNGDKFRIDL